MESASYQAIEAKANAIGWPKHWRNDLTVHDKSILESENPREFVWCLRECGTHLLWPGSAEDPCKWTSAINRTWQGRVKWFHYSAGKLRPIKPERVNDYASRYGYGDCRPIRR